MSALAPGPGSTSARRRLRSGSDAWRSSDAARPGRRDRTPSGDIEELQLPNSVLVIGRHHDASSSSSCAKPRPSSSSCLCTARAARSHAASTAVPTSPPACTTLTPYQAIGLPVDMFPVLFAIPRTAGWLAHWEELLRDPEQRINRPRQIYDGCDARSYVPVSDRPMLPPKSEPAPAASQRVAGGAG